MKKTSVRRRRKAEIEAAKAAKETFNDELAVMKAQIAELQKSKTEAENEGEQAKSIVKDMINQGVGILKEDGSFYIRTKQEQLLAQQTPVPPTNQ